MAQNRGVGSPAHHGNDDTNSCLTVITMLANYAQGKSISDEEKIAALRMMNEMFSVASGRESIMTPPHLNLINGGITQTTTRSESQNDVQFIDDQDNGFEYDDEELGEKVDRSNVSICEKTFEQSPVSGEKRKRVDDEALEASTTTTISTVDSSNDEENEKGPEVKKVRKKRMPTVAGQMTKKMMSTTSDIQAALTAAGVRPSFGRSHDTLRPMNGEKVVTAELSNNNKRVTLTINKKKTFELQNGGFFPVKKKSKAKYKNGERICHNQSRLK